MKDKPFFSVIIPCCNVAEYVEEAAQTLHSQTCGDFEALLVVETSRDNTEELCRKIAAADSRFSVIAQPRSGSPAAPRNSGFARAKGKYIVFLDGDDLLSPTALSELRETVLSHGTPDVVQIAAEEFLQKDAKTVFVKRHFNFAKCDGNLKFSGTEAAAKMYSNALYPAPMAWLSVCNADFLREFGLRQVDGLVHEDEEWTPRVLLCARTVAVLDSAIYLYRRRPNSITTTSAGAETLPWAKICASLFAFAASRDIPENLRKLLQRSWLSALFYHFFYATRKASPFDGQRAEAVKRLLSGEGADNLRKFAKGAGVPKRVGAFLISAASATFPRLGLLPAVIYFNCFYYPFLKYTGRFK